MVKCGGGRCMELLGDAIVEDKENLHGQLWVVETKQNLCERDGLVTDLQFPDRIVAVVGTGVDRMVGDNVIDQELG